MWEKRNTIVTVRGNVVSGAGRGGDSRVQAYPLQSTVARVIDGANSLNPVKVARRVRDDGPPIFSQQIIRANYVYSRPTKSVGKEAEPSVELSASGCRREGSFALSPLA